MQKVYHNEHHRRAARHLKKSDPILARLITQVALPLSTPPDSHFGSLVEAIISQQLSDKAARTILQRFRDLFVGEDFPDARQVLRMREEQIRRAGISLQKLSYIKNLARAVHGKELDFETFQELSDEEIITQLIKLRGIGRWTAEMFLIFSLNRPDVFSFGDLGLRNAIKRLYRIRGELTSARAQKIALPWRPYRTYACRYLWASSSIP